MNKVLLALLLSFSIVWNAQSQVQFSFGSDTISTTDGSVDVDVLISGFQDVISMQLSLNWDASVFSYSSIENITTELPEFTEGNIGTPETAVVVDDGELTISWSRASTGPETLPDGTRLFTLRLNGAGALCSGTQIELSNTPRVIEVVDNDLNELTVTSAGGNVEIRDDSCGNNTGGDKLRFNLADVSASAGSTVCIPVTADNFTDIFSFQTGVQWDPAVLRFTEIRDAGLQSVTTNDANASQGNINVIWVFDQEAVSLANGATLFEICFEVIGNTGQTTGVSLVDLPGFGIEVGIEDGVISDFEVSNASFTVGGSNNMTGVGVIGGDIFTENSPTICIPVTTRNFSQVGAFQVGVNFDPSVLSYTGIMPGALSGVDVGDNDSAQGDLKILWQADFSTPSVTLDDDAVLFELCFDVIGSVGQSSPIGFVNLPDFGIEFSSELGTSLEFFVIDGSITVGTNTNTAPLSLTASSVSVERGGEVCVDITAAGFTDIQGMGFALMWDPTVLTFIEPRNFNLTNLGASSFSPLGSDRLAVLWTLPAGQSVADGTSIFQACFRAVDPCGPSTSSAISFVQGNTAIEIIGPGNEVLDPQLNTGTVSISNCVVDPGDLSINVLDVTNPTCSGNTNGVVSVDFSGASGAVMCLWTRDSDNLQITANCNLLGSPGGSYTLRAEDQSGAVATRTVVLSDPDPIVVQADIINGSCNGTGQIALRVSGGTVNMGTYNYMWSSDLPAQPTVTGLTAGTYRVSVTDNNGCQVVEDFVVEDNTFPLNPVVMSVTDPDAPNGSIDLNPGAGADLSYSWSTGETTPSISDLNVGTYTVTITDNTDTTCTLERTFTLGADFISGSLLIESAISRYNGFGVSCNGESDGIIDGEVVGGCPDGPIVVSINGVAVTLPANNLPAGDHVLRLEDACGGVYEEMFTLEEPDAIVYNGISGTPDCPDPEGSSTGSVELNVEGGTGVYSLTPSIGTFASGTTIEDLPVGTFTVVIQDENGCQLMVEDELSEEACNRGMPGLCEGRSFISPNGDNVNDNFLIPCVDDPDNRPNNLTIYDRWGNLVMEANDYNNSWTGTDVSGEPLPEGGYMWVLTTGGPGSRDLFRGTVSILR